MIFRFNLEPVQFVWEADEIWLSQASDFGLECFWDRNKEKTKNRQGHFRRQWQKGNNRRKSKERSRKKRKENLDIRLSFYSYLSKFVIKLELLTHIECFMKMRDLSHFWISVSKTKLLSKRNQSTVYCNPFQFLSMVKWIEVSENFVDEL